VITRKIKIMNQKKHQLIIGLGNPGEKYLQTRHNAGFIIIDELRKITKSTNFNLENKFNAQVSEKIMQNNENKNFLEKILHTQSRKLFLIKPQSFMNKSGEVIRKFIDFYKIPIENITVIHDDLDLTVGKFKLSKDSGSAGHNGVENIINLLGTKDFRRIKIGVETKEGREARKIPGEKFVLQRFSPEELTEIKSLSLDIRNILNL